MSSLRILVDVDGVLADFCGACIDFVKEVKGETHSPEKLMQWDTFEAMGYPYLWADFFARIETGDIVFKPLPGAQEAIAELQKHHEVVIVTAPADEVPSWTSKRDLWLKEYFGIGRDHIVHTKGKKYVAGDVFIDDNFDNCFSWHVEHMDKLTLLWDAPYNRNPLVLLPPEDTRFVRVKSWEDVNLAIEGTYGIGQRAG